MGLSRVQTAIALVCTGIFFCTNALAQKDLEQHRNYKELASVNADDILRLAVDTTSETITIVRFLREDSSNLTYRKYYFLLTQLGYDLKVRVTDTILSPSPLPPVYLDLWTAQSTMMISDADGYEASFYDYRLHKWLAKQVRMPIRRPNLNLFVQNEDVWLVPKRFSDGFVFRLPHPYKQPIAVRLADPSWAQKYGQLMEVKLLPIVGKRQNAILTYVQYRVRQARESPDRVGAMVRKVEVHLKPTFSLVAVRDSVMIAGLGPVPWNHELVFGDQHQITQKAIGILNDSAVILSDPDSNQPLIKWPLVGLKDVVGDFRPDWFYTDVAEGKPAVVIAKYVMRHRKTRYSISQIGNQRSPTNTNLVDASWQSTDVLDWPAPLMDGPLVPQHPSRGTGPFAITYVIADTFKQVSIPASKGDISSTIMLSPQTPTDKWTKSARITEFWNLGRSRLLWMTDLKRYENTGGRLGLKQQYLLRAGIIVKDR